MSGKPPEGWSSRSLSTVANIAMGETLLSKDLTGRGVPVFSANTDSGPWGYTDLNSRRLKRGAIVVGARGSIGFPRLPVFETFTSTQTTISVEPDTSVVDSTYLHAVLCAADIKSLAAQQAVPMLTIGMLAPLSIPLPPLDEQQRIAEVLRSVDRTIEAQDNVCRQLSAVFTSTSEACFTAADWPPHRLGDLCASLQVGIVVRPASYYVDSGGIPALRSLNVLENRLALGDLVHISEAGHAANQKSSLRAGDVVTRRTGEPGKTAMISAGFEGGLNCIDIIFSRPKDHLRSAYLSFFMNSDAAKRQVAGLQGGLAQQHLNVGEMKKLLLPLPDLQTQDRTVEVLDDMWTSMEASRHALAKLSTLKSGLASDLLSGHVRVSA